MKTTLTRLLKILALLLPIALFVFFMQTYIFCYLDQSTERIRRFYLEEENSLDVVFLGASDVPTAFAPGLAYEQNGFTSYLYTIDGNPGSLYKYQLKEILSKQDPQAIIVEVNGFLYNDGYQNQEVRLRMFAESIPFSLNKLDAIYHYNVDDKIDYLFPFIKYHGDWIKGRNLLESYQWKTNKANGPALLKGITTCTLVAPYDPASIQLPGQSTPAIAEDYLVDFLEYCKDEGITDLLFVRFPHRNAATHAAAVSQVGAVLARYGHSLLNLEEQIDEIGLDFDRDFFNDEHMNIYGMEKMTAYFGNYLADNILESPLPQTDANTHHWAERVAAYEVFRAYAFDLTEKGIEAWPGEEPYEISQIEKWLNGA